MSQHQMDTNLLLKQEIDALKRNETTLRTQLETSRAEAKQKDRLIRLLQDTLQKERDLEEDRQRNGREFVKQLNILWDPEKELMAASVKRGAGIQGTLVYEKDKEDPFRGPNAAKKSRREADDAVTAKKTKSVADQRQAAALRATKGSNVNSHQQKPSFVGNKRTNEPIKGGMNKGKREPEKGHKKNETRVKVEEEEGTLIEDSRSPRRQRKQFASGSTTNKRKVSTSTEEEEEEEEEEKMPPKVCAITACSSHVSKEGEKADSLLCNYHKTWEHVYHVDEEEGNEGEGKACFFCIQLKKGTGKLSLKFTRKDYGDQFDEELAEGEGPQGDASDWIFYWNLFHPSKKFNVKIADTVYMRKRDESDPLMFDIFRVQFLVRDVKGVDWVSGIPFVAPNEVSSTSSSYSFVPKIERVLELEEFQFFPLTNIFGLCAVLYQKDFNEGKPRGLRSEETFLVRYSYEADLHKLRTFKEGEADYGTCRESGLLYKQFDKPLDVERKEQIFKGIKDITETRRMDKKVYRFDYFVPLNRYAQEVVKKARKSKRGKRGTNFKVESAKDLLF